MYLIIDPRTWQVMRVSYRPIWQGKKRGVLVTNEVQLLPWLGIKFRKWGVLLLAIRFTNKEGFIKFGGEATWDFISTFVLNWFSCLNIGFWWWFDWMFGHNSIFVLILCTWLSMFQLCFVEKVVVFGPPFSVIIYFCFLVVKSRPFVGLLRMFLSMWWMLLCDWELHVYWWLLAWEG